MKDSKLIHTKYTACVLCRKWRRTCIREENSKKCNNCLRKKIECIRFKPANVKESIVNLIKENSELKKKIKLHDEELEELKSIIKEKHKIDKRLKKIVNKL
ncbi:hypothetical protein F8M41_020794 [Gigaspora margarita]|uniref:Zn(2)-C6 fungal-type domain-containing protein n=1 Tax=Gigaspora margarita TaxID=4874 RepID=A0A8H4EJI4_GIGMA|nr:hypothetical protein F8M41_020794 [Gigaspora margarita]